MAINATRILMKYPEEHDVEMSSEQKSGMDPLNCREVNFVRTVELSKSLKGARQLKIHGEMVDVRAEIKLLGQFSAHRDYSEILPWLWDFKRAPKGVFIVHGEPEPQKALREKIVRELDWKVTRRNISRDFDSEVAMRST